MADDTATSFSKTPDDPTPYIRTYAKDVARLTGTKTAQPAGPKKDAPTPGVQFGEVDMSQTQGTRNDSASPREFPQEQISVTKDDTFENLTMPAREDKRDEILSRLRAKVQPAAPAPTAIPATAAPLPIVPAPVPAPVPTPPPAPIIPTAMPFAPASSPTPPPAPIAMKQHRPLFSRHEPDHSTEVPTSDLHTFKSDFADRIDSQKASTFSVLAAQGDAPDTRAPQPVKLPSKNKSRLPMILAAVVLVVLGIGGLGGAYWFVALRSPIAMPFTVPSLIFADEKIELPNDTAPLAALAHVAQQTSVSGNVIVTYTTATSNGKAGVIKTPQPGGPLIKKMLSSAPDILLRNIDDTSTVGVINAGNANAPFFILHVTSYERTFAGMLGWEPTIGSDLASLYPANGAGVVPHFIDATVANHDVRVLKDDANNTILLYGYRDKQTLIIAKDEAAFTALLVRLNAANGS